MDIENYDEPLGPTSPPFPTLSSTQNVDVYTPRSYPRWNLDEKDLNPKVWRSPHQHPQPFVPQALCPTSGLGAAGGRLSSPGKLTVLGCTCVEPARLCDMWQMSNSDLSQSISKKHSRHTGSSKEYVRTCLETWFQEFPSQSHKNPMLSSWFANI